MSDYEMFYPKVNLPLNQIIETIEKGSIVIDKDYNHAYQHQVVRYNQFVVYIGIYGYKRSTLACFFDESKNHYGIFNYGNPCSWEFMDVRTDSLTELANKLRIKLGLEPAKLGGLHFEAVAVTKHIPVYICNRCGEKMKTYKEHKDLLTCQCGNIRHDRDLELEKKYCD